MDMFERFVPQDSLNTQSLGLLENQWYPSSGYTNSLPENRNSRKTTTSLVSYQQPQSFQASNKAYQKENSYTTESKITNEASYFGNEEEKGIVGERKKRSYSVVSQMPHVNKKMKQEQTSCYVNQQEGNQLKLSYVAIRNNSKMMSRMGNF